MPLKNKRNKKLGPVAGKRKKDLNVYNDTANNARVPIPRSDLKLVKRQRLSVVNGTLSHDSVVERRVLKDITNFYKDRALGIEEVD